MNALTREEFDTLKAGAAAILGTAGDVLVVAGEAILGIEAYARCLAAPGRRILNIDNGPYGRDMGKLIRECGAEVHEIVRPWNTAVTADEVEEAVRQFRPEVMTYVYAEAVSGVKTLFMRSRRSRGNTVW